MTRSLHPPAPFYGSGLLSTALAVSRHTGRFASGKLIPILGSLTHMAGLRPPPVRAPQISLRPPYTHIQPRHHSPKRTVSASPAPASSSLHIPSCHCFSSSLSLSKTLAGAHFLQDFHRETHTNVAPLSSLSSTWLMTQHLVGALLRIADGQSAPSSLAQPWVPGLCSLGDSNYIFMR